MKLRPHVLHPRAIASTAMRRRRLTLALPIGSLLVMATAAAASVPVATGSYSASVSEVHSPFRFKVIGTTPGQCGTRSGARCFIGVNYPKIRERCAHGLVEANAFAVPSGTITSTGRFSYFQRLTSDSPFISFTATIKGDRAHGTLREKDHLADGTSTMVCDSGTLHWSATRR